MFRGMPRVPASGGGVLDEEGRGKDGMAREAKEMGIRRGRRLGGGGGGQVESRAGGIGRTILEVVVAVVINVIGEEKVKDGHSE